ncbi:MAG: hypothetical protein AB7S69_02700 [Salinivirgaceae bacterium]|jgi:hypothetical protein
MNQINKIDNGNWLQGQSPEAEDKILLTLNDFEKELRATIHLLEQSDEAPEIALKLLFQKLYVLLLNKPYYRAIIFDEELVKGDNKIHLAVMRIKTIAEQYLSTIINKGKMEQTFKNQESTSSLVGKILAGFRLFMKDEQLIDDMIFKLKNLNTLKD